MKKLEDGTEVSMRSFYYLLDFNEKDEWKFIHSNFNKLKLGSLNKEEYKLLFEHATRVELKTN